MQVIIDIYPDDYEFFCNGCGEYLPKNNFNYEDWRPNIKNRLCRACQNKTTPILGKEPNKFFQTKTSRGSEKHRWSERLQDSNFHLCDKLHCEICHEGPLPRNQRVDTIDEWDRDVTWCLSCYQKYLKEEREKDTADRLANWRIVRGYAV